MAQKVLVQLVDDLDGESATDISTVTFSLDGVDYEIDLSSDNAERIRGAFGPYVDAARRTGGRLKRGVRPGGQAANPGEASQIREWANENGFELAARGRIPANVVEAYKSAQVAEEKKVKSRPAARRSKKA